MDKKLFNDTYEVFNKILLEVEEAANKGQTELKPTMIKKFKLPLDKKLDYLVTVLNEHGYEVDFRPVKKDESEEVELVIYW
jgi:predicted ArsR family transcriptional regulator